MTDAMAVDHFCLRWNNYQSNMVSELDILRTEEYLVDVTLCCEGHKFRAHKVILSACSPYFRNVFKENPCEHPVVILKDVSPDDVEALLSFVYQGVVYVSEKKLSSFLQTAELLQIKGLAGAASCFNDDQAKPQTAQQSPVKRRKSAPVRIVKHEEGEENNSFPMDSEDDGGVKNDYHEEMAEDNKLDDEGSGGDESESENSGDVNASSYAAVDLREDGMARERLQDHVKVEPATPSTLLQQTLARQRAAAAVAAMPPHPSMDSSPQNMYAYRTIRSIYDQFQGPMPNQGLSDLLSPTAERDRRRPCPFCTKVISNKSNLLKHMRIRHSDVYDPACCVLCNKMFKNKYSLRAHLNIYHKEYIAPPPQHSQPAPPPPQPQTFQPMVETPQFQYSLPGV